MTSVINSRQPDCNPAAGSLDKGMSFNRQDLAERAASLAAQGVYVGTSSWKYTGWCGTIYDHSRYEYRGKFVETRFKRDCSFEVHQVHANTLRFLMP